MFVTIFAATVAATAGVLLVCAVINLLDPQPKHGWIVDPAMETIFFQEGYEHAMKELAAHHDSAHKQGYEEGYQDAYDEMREE